MRLETMMIDAALSTQARALVIMGVSGSGKSTVAALLAERLDWEMMEGDSLHPPANVEKMRKGVPLDDVDRAPWLDRIGEELRAWAAAGRSGVLTCSALKRAYRARILAARPDVRFVYLKGSKELIGSRVSGRHHEYMPASLLASQFDTLEEPAPGEPVIVVDAGRPPDVEVQEIIEAIGHSGSETEPESRS
jgi:gluconokinase